MIIHYSAQASYALLYTQEEQVLGTYKIILCNTLILRHDLQIHWPKAFHTKIKNEWLGYRLVTQFN